MSVASVRRIDPDRRSRIIDACLDVLSAEGVAGTSHRRVAVAADVPLGSMTYHFAGMDDLLTEAFTRFADRAADDFANRLRTVSTADEARVTVAAMIEEDVAADPRGLVLTHELYTLAARDPRYRTIADRWLDRNHEVLLRFFDPVTARILDAVIEGFTLHRALSTRLDEASQEAREAVERITRVRRTPDDGWTNDGQ